MAKKIKILSVVLVFWLGLFIAWEWWYSYPKVRINSISKVSSQSEGIDSILQHAMSANLLPGISAAIVENDKVIYLNAFGYENLEMKDSLTVESKILVASVSKIFTALGLASTFESHNIHPKDPVSSLGLGEKFNSSSFDNIRLQDLLLHQSGIRDKSFSERIISSSKSQNLTEWGMEFVEDFSKYHTDSITYRYSDSNYDLLGFLLSQSENLDFNPIIQKEVFMPVGMMNSEFVTDWPIEKDGITGYQKTFLWKRIEPKRIKFQLLPSPSSGLITTTKDMSIALINLLRGDSGIYQKELAWLKDHDFEAPLGFQKTQINGSEWVGHFGGQAGYSSLFFYSERVDMGIFLFANARDKDDFRISIANQLISYISLN